MSKLIELQAELDRAQSAMNYHTRHGGSKEDANYKELEEKEAAILAQMDYAKREEANAAITEDVMNSDLPYILEVNGQEINFREYITKETDYQVIAIAVRQKIDEVEYGYNAQLTEQSKRFDQERQQYRDQLDAADRAADEKYNELYEQFHQMKIEKEELERKLQNAGLEIDQLKTENTELKNRQTEPAKPTNMDTSALAEAIKAANAAKPAIYNVHPLDNLSKRFGANLLETDEPIDFSYLEKGRYRVVDDAEVQRFREDRAAAEAAVTYLEESNSENPPLVEAVVPPTPQFQDEDTSGGLAGNPVVPESNEDTVSGPVTRAEFEELKGRVDILFANQNIGFKEAS